MSAEQQDASTASSSRASSPRNESGPGVFGRLLNTLRPPLSRTTTSSQLDTLPKAGSSSSKRAFASSSSLSSSNGGGSTRPRRNSTPPRPSSRGSEASGAVASTSRAGAGASSAINAAGNSATPRSSVEASRAYSPSMSGSASRQASPLSSPPHLGHGLASSSNSNLNRANNSSSNLSSTSNPNNLSARPALGRRQSSTRRLAAVLARPLFRRSSSQTANAASAQTSAAQQPQHQGQARDAQSNAAPRSISTSSLGVAGSTATTSGPPSPVAATSTTGTFPASGTGSTGTAGRRQITVSSATARSATSSHSALTPIAAGQSSPHPSPFFAVATPTTTSMANPFAAAVDCVPVLTQLFSQPITATLALLVPFSFLYPYSHSNSATQYPSYQHGLGSLPSASSISVASSSISEAPTSSSAHQASAAGYTQSSSYSALTPGALSACVSNEQLAASSLSIPTTAVSTFWRISKAIEWITEHGPALNSLILSRMNPMTPRAAPPTAGPHDASRAPSSVTAAQETAPCLPVFDFSALLQSILDVLAASSSHEGVDVVYFHGLRQSYYQGTNQANRDSSNGGSSASPTRNDPHDLHEAFVRADERGLGVAILAVLHQVLGDLQHGSTLEVGLSAALNVPDKGTAPAKSQTLSDLAPDSAEEDDDVDVEQKLGTYMLTIELTATGPSVGDGEPVRPGVDPSSGPARSDSTVIAALMQYLHLSFIRLPKKADCQVYKITCVLPQAWPPSRHGPPTEPGLRRRKSMDQAKEPSLAELVRFADSSLRAKKVALHALEHSCFARHISHHLSNWGLEVNHIAIVSDEDGDGLRGHTGSTTSERGHLGRLDSGFGGSDGPSPPSGPMGGATPAALSVSDPLATFIHRNEGSVSSPPLDPSLHFIIIDDDISALRRQITSLRNSAPTMQLQNALLAKRPQLQSRRTRSSQAVQQRVVQTPVSIIHFTSLANYRQIKDIVQGMLKTASPVFTMPEVLVVPKPAGPRRLLNTLYNAVRRPMLDAHYAPIATSPSSPGAQYFFAGGRPSPAPSNTNQNEFDAAAAVALSQARNSEQAISASVSQASGPRTPPLPGQSSNPPSPASPDAMEYFSKSASELGSSASQGIIIQSPDGRPTGLFFQPRVASLAEKAESLRMSRNGDADSKSSAEKDKEKDATSQTSQTSSKLAPKMSPGPGHFQSLTANGTELPSIVIPDHFEFANARTMSATSSKGSPQQTPSLPQRQNEPNTAVSDTGSKPTRSVSQYSNDSATSSVDSLEQENENASKSPRQSSAVSPTATKMTASPSAIEKTERQQQSAVSPTASFGKMSTPSTPVFKNVDASEDGAKTPQVTPGPLVRAKSVRKSSGRVKKAPRRPTGTLVPPINVLIVEDNPINQIILSTFLKRKGIKYSVANNGQEAVDQWKGGDFHLVLMDIQLPVKDGIEATQEIRALERGNNPSMALSPLSENPTSDPSSAVTSPYELPVIIVALTASNLQSDRVNALAAGCNDFLTKPVSLQWLNQKLVEWGSMAYLSGFSNKRRSTVSSPRETMKTRQSFGTGAADLAKRLQAEQKRGKEAEKSATAAAPDFGGDKTPKSPEQDSSA